MADINWHGLLEWVLYHLGLSQGGNSSVGSAALVAGFVTLVVAGINGIVSLTVQKIKNTADEKLAIKKFDLDCRLSEQKLKQERSQALHKRKSDLAEQILVDLYQFERVFAWVRSPGSIEPEGKSRKAVTVETEEISHQRDTYFIPIERLKKEADFLGKMMSKRYLARAYFGKDMDQAYQDIHMAQQSVVIYANLLIRNVGNNQPRVQEARDRWESNIWDMPDPKVGQNEIQEGLTRAFATIERLTKPILESSD